MVNEDINKANIALVAFAVFVMVAVFFIWPHTYLYKEAYESNRQNAINYIQSVRYFPDEGYQKEVQRLIKKYQLENLFPPGETEEEHAQRILYEIAHD